MKSIEARKIIADLPIIDVMPEVKCKYCEHYFPLVKGGICKLLRVEVAEADICIMWDMRQEERNETN